MTSEIDASRPRPLPSGWFPRGVFVLQLGHVRAALEYCHARIRRPEDYGTRAAWRPAAMTSSPTTGTGCTKSRHILERGLHVAHNAPCLTDGWPGHIPRK